MSTPHNGGSPIHIKSETTKRFSKIITKGAEMVNKQQMIEEMKEQERNHEFLKLEEILAKEKAKKQY